MIHLASPEDHASKVYFAGLLLVIMLMFSWLFMHVGSALLVTAILMVSYGYVSLLKGLTIPELFINTLFLLSALFSGFITQIFRNRHLRENFILTQSLKGLVEEKTGEADDYAFKANHDELTSLPNRRYIIQQLENSLEMAKQNNTVLLVLFIDLTALNK